ncbi:hypothetical protein [Streptomyces sp. ISL-10]|nr:hypothetical protein [Streptomyces sp. ISL-10]
MPTSRRDRVLDPAHDAAALRALTHPPRMAGHGGEQERLGAGGA